MIHLYSFNTPNSYKISIALEEMGLPYQSHPVDVRQGQHMQEEFLQLNPLGKVPVIRDDDTGMVLAESNAILLYLAERTHQLLPSDGPSRALIFKWLFFQASTLGPMFGELGHYMVLAKEKIPYAVERYSVETRRILGLLDEHLAKCEFLEGSYSIADIAHFGWLEFLRQRGIPLGECKSLTRWMDTIASRPAVMRGMRIPLPVRG
jgi:GSH-dependent disulfide-bond oxidoreductase